MIVPCTLYFVFCFCFVLCVCWNKERKSGCEKNGAGSTACDPEIGLHCGHPQREADSPWATAHPTPVSARKNHATHTNPRTSMNQNRNKQSLESTDD